MTNKESNQRRINQYFQNGYKVKVYEFDSDQDSGVSLEFVSAWEGSICCNIKVNEISIAAYIGPRDVQKIIDYLKRWQEVQTAATS